MRWHPVHDDTDPMLVERIDKIHEILRRAVAGSRGEVAGGLVAPRAVKWVLAHRHQLHVSEVHAGGVVGEQRRNFAVRQQTVVLAAPPRSQMHLINRPRCGERITLGAIVHPIAVLPLIVEPPAARGGARRHFPIECKRIALVHTVVVEAGHHAIFVARAWGDVRDESLPQSAAIAARGQRMSILVPAVEIPEHRHTKPRWAPTK